ncbi:lanthionine synthetase-like protein [Haloactinospora alba]|uniref:Lanthionine synthetase-like protein n=1 Tax=Haloactinospora alba TaxID=405555 RepID=A0A543N7M2_9ACTN|nr:lanthionine synthetase C family protein [Haloactinospora alba]TQN27810.1 lanthionine synthetase-like protein [Haloactinospora alba]
MHREPQQRARTTTHTHPGQSLASGACGIALLHIERARTQHGDWNTAHAWLAAASQDTLTADTDACLYFGAPALAFALHTAAGTSHRYEHTLATLDTSITALTRRRLDNAHARIDHNTRPAPSEFDLIHGLTGLGTYHLRRHPHSSITAEVLSYLVRLSAPLPGDSGQLPGWWTDLGPTGQPSPAFPRGHGNLGMAHGISGPLALLSLALRRGVTVEDHTEAIQRICFWLDTWRRENGTTVWWPQWVTRAELYGHRSHHPEPQRPSWCYGTPGMARAQQLAAIATGDTRRQLTAERALLGCLTDPVQRAQITEAGLCHGWAGLCHTTRRAAADALTPDIASHLPELDTSPLDRPSESSRDLGLLTGTAGAALALHTAHADTPATSGWDACLLVN